MAFRAAWHLPRGRAGTPCLPTENTRCGCRAHLWAPHSAILSAEPGHHCHPTGGQAHSSVIPLCLPPSLDPGQWMGGLSLCPTPMPSIPSSPPTHMLGDPYTTSPHASPLHCPAVSSPEEPQPPPLLKEKPPPILAYLNPLTPMPLSPPLAKTTPNCQ